ncbi:MAG: ribosome silencing factor [Rhodobacteraceae bacterium]|nr:ribosome silencing factor [Paracoccaceae bacterium]
MPLADLGKPDAGDTLCAAIVAALDADKAEDIVQIDLRGRSEMGDWMVIASGRSSRQVSALAEKLSAKLKTDFGINSKLEGRTAGDWVLIDSGDVIVHIFRPEVRDFYQLEKMWMPQSAADTDA